MNFNPTPRKSQGATLGSTPAQSRFRSSLVPMSRPSPARSFQPAAKPTGTLRTTRPARDLFGTATPRSTRSTQFAPTLSPAVTKAAAGARKFASGKKNTGAGMAATTSTELFKMRIPEPDPDLTGEALAKSIPEALTRKGTVYADQYLADKCPPQFDDLQRRQFFCILDLRRLKHAANEIFAKKDWKLNILNFAKEYEKSRGLIMLHYGLYEFKNVKPSEEVMRRWRAAHGLPNPEPEKVVAKPPASFNSSVGNATPGLGKRKADDDLQPRDNALKASTVNQNKKRNVEVEEVPTTDDAPKFAPSPTKSKRKTEQVVEEDPDESQRNKMQKTPSSARSRLEGIINNVQSGSTTPAGTPLKRPALDQSQSLFASKKQTDGPQNSPFALKSNPFASTNGATSGAPQLKSSLFQPGQTLNGDSGSVLSGHKFGVAPAAGSGNIFGYLSESSAPSSGNEKDDADDEPDTESESENGQGSQEVVPSEEPSAAASTGTATPPIQGAGIFNLGKPTTTLAPFGAPTKPTENTAKGGLFGRVSFGSDGQPLRAASAEEAPRPSSPVKESVPEPVQSTTPAAKVPGDFTFNPATTPINFSSKGSLGSSVFGAKPAVETASAQPKESGVTNSSSVSSLFGAKPAELPPAASAPPSSQPLFGSSKQNPEAATSTSNGGSAQSIFGTQKPASAAPPMFGTPQKAADTEPTKNIFGAFDTPQKATETQVAKEPAKSIFGTPAPKSNANSAAPSTPLFGALKKPSETGQAAPNGATAPSIFSNGVSTPSTNIFGASTSAPETSSSKREYDDSEGRPAKRHVFGKPAEDSSDQPPKRGSLFGTSQPDTTTAPSVQDTKPIFGGSSTLFGSTTPKPDATAPASSFASNASAAAPIFSFGASAPSEPKHQDLASASAGINNNIFGTPAPAASTPSFTFGAQGTPAKDATTGPSFTFGTQSTPARDVSAAPSPVFSFGGTQPSAPAPSFGGTQSTAAAPSFGGFGSQANGPGPAKIDFNFSGSSAPGGNSSSFVFGGDQNQAPNTGSFTFTAGGPGPSNTNGQSFGGASNTTTPAGSFNFQFGGPSTPKPAEQGSSFTFGSQPNEHAGAPGFSFTSSTPQAAPPKAPSVFGGLLQPGGGTSTGASK